MPFRAVLTRVSAISLTPEGDVLITGFCDGESHFPTTNGKDLVLGRPKKQDEYHQPQFVFLTRYTASGKRKWAKVFSESWGEGISVAANSKDEIYLSLYFKGTLRDGDQVLDSLPRPEHGNNRVAVFKLSGTGEVLKRLPIRYTQTDSHVYVAPNLLIDHADHLILYGNFSKAIRLDAETELTNDSYYESLDAYIARYSAQDELLWARVIGGQHYQHVSDLAVDRENRIYVTGDYTYECLVSEETRVIQKSVTDQKTGTSFFYGCFDTDGDLSFMQFHSVGNYGKYCTGTSLRVDDRGYTYVAGNYNDTLQFSSATARITGQRETQGFVSIWKGDSIIHLQQDIALNRGWANQRRLRLSKRRCVVAGFYYGDLHMIRSGKKLSNRDYGRASYVYSMPLPYLPENTRPVRDSVGRLARLEPFFECVSPELNADPAVWVPDTDSDTIRLPDSGEDAGECAVRLQREASLYPNPTSQKSTLVLKELHGPVSITILTEGGKLMLAQEVLITKDVQEFELDLGRAVPGTYFVYIRQDGFSKMLRLVKIN